MVLPSGHGISFRSDENVLKLTVVMVAQHCECTKCHWTVQFKKVKIVYFMLCIT